MHSISDVERNFPVSTVLLNLHLMFLVSWKFDPIAITRVPPLTGPYLGFASNR
jgi:hypothetical protein